MSRPRKRNKHLPAYVRIRNGSYLYKDIKLCRVSEGESRMYQLLAERKQLKHLDSVPAAVAAYKLQYLPGLSDSAKKEHGRILDLFAKEFDRFQVAQVETADISESMEALYPDAPFAAKHYKSRVMSFFRWAVNKRLTKTNPCLGLRMENMPKAKKTAWTAELFWSVNDQLTPMYQCYHQLSFLLYQRTTDIRKLRRSDVRDGVIHFAPSKTIKSSGAEIDIPITPAIQAVLDRAAEISRQWRVISPYVIHTRSGTPYTATGIRSAYRRASSVPGLHPKALLPFAMQQAEKRGFSRRQLQVGRGHTSITTTEGYMATHAVPVSEVMQELPERKN